MAEPAAHQPCSPWPRRLAAVLALVFALPSCITALLWSPQRHVTSGELACDAAMVLPAGAGSGLQIGLRLTESYAMFPTAAVSGFYFAHPDARYFSVGKIARDQLESYAQRKGMSIGEAERWLAPIIGYDPGAADAA